MKPTNRTDGWTKLAVFQYYGFAAIGKYFAYIAGPLLALLLLNRKLCQFFYESLTLSTQTSQVSWLMLISIFYGVCEVIYGLLSGYSAITALQLLVFNLCPLYLFLGIWAGSTSGNLLRQIIRINAWYGVVYSVAYYAFLRNLNSDTFAGPSSGSTILLGLFCFESNLLSFSIPILVASFDTIASQIRADWAGFGVALIIWAVAAKRIGRVFSMAAIMILLLLIGFIFDFRMPGLPGRGGDISARDTVGRALSSFNPSYAKELNRDADSLAGTVKWRQTWWKEIREVVYANPLTTVFGMGYGYPIADLMPELRGTDIRTPHSVFYFNLCYSGYIGVVIFFALQLSIMRLHWRTYQATGQIYGLVYHVCVLTTAFFGNFFEAPQGAIPTYLMLGLAIAPIYAKAGATDGPSEFIGAPSRVAHQSLAVKLR